MFYRDERLALFIDGSNLYAAAKSLGFDIDYKLLRAEFMRRGKMLDKARQRIHRQHGPPEGEGEHGHRTDRRCHGIGPPC